MDATFGSAIQTIDKTLRALSIGTQRLFYHQGTINQGKSLEWYEIVPWMKLTIFEAFFNWWRSDQLNAPFYGAYFGALAAAGGDHIVASDSGSDLYAQYIIYRNGKPFKLVFINTDYYSGSGLRSTTNFTATGLKSGHVKALRMTGPSSETTVSVKQTDPSLEPHIGGMHTRSNPSTSLLNPFCHAGQYFSNRDCSIRGAQKFEKFIVQKGKLVVPLKASEALIVYL
jgi:hypothetical protein